MLDGLSEQPVGHADGIRDLRPDAFSEVVTGFVNTQLGIDPGLAPKITSGSRRFFSKDLLALVHCWERKFLNTLMNRTGWASANRAQ